MFSTGQTVTQHSNPLIGCGFNRHIVITVRIQHRQVETRKPQMYFGKSTYRLPNTCT